jgi:hypothetical protein
VRNWFHWQSVSAEVQNEKVKTDGQTDKQQRTLNQESSNFSAQLLTKVT